MVPQPPIIIAEGADIVAFESVEAAARWLEPPDVADEVYRGFDAAGRRLRLTTDGRSVGVSVAAGEPEPRALAEVLSVSLRRPLAAAWSPGELPALVGAFVARSGFTR